MYKLTLIAFFLLLFSSCNMCEEQERQARNDGYNEGKIDGRSEGIREGLEKGRGEGLKIGKDSGIIAGKTIGFEEGYNKGLKEGYYKGYGAGELYNEKKHIEKNKSLDMWITKVCNYLIVPLFGISIFLIIILLIYKGRGYGLKGISLRIASASLPFLGYSLFSGLKENTNIEIYTIINQNIIVICFLCILLGFMIPFFIFQLIKNKKHIVTNFLIVFYTFFLVVFVQIYFDHEYNYKNTYIDTSFVMGTILYFMIFQNPSEFVQDMWEYIEVEIITPQQSNGIVRRRRRRDS